MYEDGSFPFTEIAYIPGVKCSIRCHFATLKWVRNQSKNSVFLPRLWWMHHTNKPVKICRCTFQNRVPRFSLQLFKKSKNWPISFDLQKSFTIIASISFEQVKRFHHWANQTGPEISIIFWNGTQRHSKNQIFNFFFLNMNTFCISAAVCTTSNTTYSTEEKW